MQRFRRPLTLLFALSAAAFAFVAVPIFVIRPFRAQGARELALSLVLTRWSPLATALLLVAGVAVAFAAWTAASRRQRLAGMFAVVILLVSAAAARVNIFERMFHPVSGARFAAAAESHLPVEDNDMVMAVRVGRGQAGTYPSRTYPSRAYPVRAMGYHHILNDVVNGEPIVATY